MKRFTRDGATFLEEQLAVTCQEVSRRVSNLIPAWNLEGLFLGGGYGRGEGGVLEGEQPYNDLEFYVFARTPRCLSEWLYGHALAAAGHQIGAPSNLEVDFKLLTFADFRRSPTTMFYYDLASGHRCLLGRSTDLTDCSWHLNARRIPAYEATRLLFNRGSGLLFSAYQLAQAGWGPEKADFVGRNLAKARLALGDALLAGLGRYHWSCLRRQEELEAVWQDLPQGLVVREHHRQGVAFKLRPTRCREDRHELHRQLLELSGLFRVVWLWLESRRLGHEFASVTCYLDSAINKCPETKPWKNRLLNARLRGPTGLLDASYPREHLFYEMADMLWNAGTMTSERVLRYQKLWSRFG